MVHVPVLLKEVIELMAPFDGGRYFDGTLGDGGHASAILEASSPSGELAGCDVDREAVERAGRSLGRYAGRAHLFVGSYTSIDRITSGLGWEGLDGILVDLGVSSRDLLDAQRGFSFTLDGPLDMRYDRSRGVTAHEVVNRYDERELARIIREYGEERFAKRIARRIVEARPIETTATLASVVSEAIPRSSWPRKIHPATKTFQAVRMEVNAELENLSEFLPKAASLLNPGGVLAVISFHSLEDRIVKRFMSPEAGRPFHGRRPPVQPDAAGFALERVTKKPVTASPGEIAANPRARSAKLRAARRVA